MILGGTITTLLTVAWLLPLGAFAIVVLIGPRLGRGGAGSAYVSTAAIAGSFLLSLVALIGWAANYQSAASQQGAGQPEASQQSERHASHDATDRRAGPFRFASAQIDNLGEAPPAKTEPEPVPTARGHANPPPLHVAGHWYTLAAVDSLRLTIGYYIDALTVAMFAMITLIATCIHVYSMGYMHEELHQVTDREVLLSDGQTLVRPGRYARFFQYLSLFCFSMLGIVIAGNLAMVFVFWELVGICSYFLIGFYRERHAASSAAMKAFVVNRVGDFGMLVGLMALWGALGTFNFADTPTTAGTTEPGLFSRLRPAQNDYQLVVPAGMVQAAAHHEVAELVSRHAATPAGAQPAINSQTDQWRRAGYGQWLLIVAGLGIFCGCVGKSAQFPLHVWLPDAMEGPTPVSALVHSATMVAAGVYLVGRCFPMFTPDVLLVIAYIGCATLLIAATIAIVATDIKRVLAYSTISQLGYMMLALGVGGWGAAMLHLITHAFFKSLLFLGAGSVIHATGTNDLRLMGGLRRKLPWTSGTMLIGCLAIMGAGVPFIGGFSGFHSKDSILAQVLSFVQANPQHGVLFPIALGGAAITAFYMFRLWYLAFAGEPRDAHHDEHAHESPRVMIVPLVVLATFAVAVAWPWFGLERLLEQARPLGTLLTASGDFLWPSVVYPHEHLAHGDAVHIPATLLATGAAVVGFLIATIFYGWRLLDPREVVSTFAPIYRVLVNQWYFDALYRWLFVRPTLLLAHGVAGIDRWIIDPLVGGLATLVRQISTLDDTIDRLFVDGAVNRLGDLVHGGGVWLRHVQTGKLRQYVMFLALATVLLFILASLLWNAPSVASGTGAGPLGK